MIKFSILSAFRRKGVALLAILGIALGSGLLVALLSLSGGIETRFNRTFQQLSGTISVIAEGGSPLGRILGSTGDPLPESYVKQIQRLEGVEFVSSFVSASVRSEKFGLLGSFGIGLTGIVEGEGLFGNPNQKIVEGESFSGENEVIAGVEIFEATRFADIDLKVGDKLSVPVGQTKEFLELTLVGIFETGVSINDHGLFGSEELARKLAQIDKDKVSGISVRVSDPTTVNEIASQIEALFEDKDPAVTAFVPGDIFEKLSSFLDIFDIFLLSISLVAAAAGGTAVMVVMLLTVFERRREFGVLKAAGWSNWNIVSSVIITSLTLALLGVFLGILLGVGTALGLQNLVSSVTNREFVAFTPEIFAWAAGVGVFTGLIGGLLPAINAARVSPIETLRSE